MQLPDWTDPKVRADAVREAAARTVEPLVLDTVRVTTPAQERSKDALSRGVAVVTGQQAGLFGGPLYTLHKAAAAIVNARRLEEETGVPVAPVFWLQDEDHDFDEIAGTWLLDGDLDLHEARLDGASGDPRAPVAERGLEEGVATALAVAAEALEGLPHTDDVLALLRRCYTAGTSVSSAFHELIEALFADHGLLVVDPMHPTLRPAAASLHAEAIERAGPLATVLREQAAWLEAQGRPVPVHVRPGSPLCFVHPDGDDGPRYRAEPDADGWLLCGTERTLSDAALRQAPHTTSALLRPILQDRWLPTAAYVGGPGELAYLAQLPPLWRAFDLPVPLVVPRARFALLDPSTRRALDALALGLDDLEQPRDALLARLGTARGDLPDPNTLTDDVTREALAVLEAFRAPADALSDGLGRSVDKTRDHLVRSVERLVERYRKALARDDGILCDRLDRVRAMLRPQDAPQERILGFAPFAARVGTDRLVQTVLDAVIPFDGTLREVML